MNPGYVAPERRLGVSRSYIPPESSDQDDIHSPLQRNIVCVDYGEGKNTVEGEPTVKLEMPLMEIGEIEKAEGVFFDENKTTTISLLQKHSLVRVTYPNPAYTQEEDLDKKLFTDIPRSLTRRFKEGEVFALDPSIPYKFKVFREDGKTRLIRVNTKSNTSWEILFPSGINFDEVESRIQAQRGEWNKIAEAVPVSFASHDTNLFADDPTYDAVAEVQQKTEDTTNPFKEAAKAFDPQDRSYRQAAIEKTFLIPPGELPKRLNRIGDVIARMDEEEFGHLSPEELEKLQREHREKRRAAAEERLKQKQERGIRAQQFAESYPIYEVFVTDEVEVDPFHEFHIFYQAAKEAGYDLKIVTPLPEGDQASRRSSSTAERLIVMTNTENTRHKLDELQKLSWRHKRDAILDWIDKGEPRALLELIRGNEEKVYGEGVNVWAATRKQGIPIEDINFLRRCFMRAEQRRRERHERYAQGGIPLSTGHLFNEASSTYDQLSSTVKPIEAEELVKNFVPAIKELLLAHPQLVPDAPPLEKEE